MRVDEIEIPEPCPIDLREHVANATEQFHCEHCDRKVYVLSHMSKDAAARVLERRQRDNLCVAFLHSQDGELHFRKPPVTQEPVVPTARLRNPRKLLQASALALGVAACSADERAEFLGLTDGGGRGAEVSVGGGPPPQRGREDEDEQPCEGSDEQVAEQRGGGHELAVLGGAPPVLEVDEPKPGELADAEPRRVDIRELDPRHTPEPPLQALLETKIARKRDRVELTVEHCVDLTGRVVDAKLVDGDEEVGEILLETMKTWRYRPYRVDGRAVRVCTEQKLEVSFGVSMKPLPS